MECAFDESKYPKKPKVRLGVFISFPGQPGFGAVSRQSRSKKLWKRSLVIIVACDSTFLRGHGSILQQSVEKRLVVFPQIVLDHFWLLNLDTSQPTSIVLLFGSRQLRREEQEGSQRKELHCVVVYGLNRGGINWRIVFGKFRLCEARS